MFYTFGGADLDTSCAHAVHKRDKGYVAESDQLGGVVVPADGKQAHELLHHPHDICS